MKNSAVLYQKKDNIAIISFNRPDRLNAINQDLLSGFIEKLNKARDDEEAMSVILTGNGRAFCAGDDLKETSSGKSFDQWAREIEALQETQRIILRLGKPLIAAVRGYAVGGGLEFAMASDIRIAAEDAKFGFPETSVGLTVTNAGTKLITQLVGLGKAKEMVFTGDFINAEEALRIGLVNYVVPKEKLMEASFAMCKKINEKSPFSLKLSRIAIDMGLHSSFEQILEIEADHLLACVASGNEKKFVDKKMKKMKKMKNHGGINVRRKKL